MKGLRIIPSVPLGLVLVSACGRCLSWAGGSPQLESIGSHLLLHGAQSSSATLEGQAAELWNEHVALEEGRPSAWLQHCLQVLVEAYPDTHHDAHHTRQHQHHRAAVCGRLEGPWSEGPRPGLPPSAKRRLRSSSWVGGGWSPHVSLQEGSSWATFDNDRDVISLLGAACCVLCAAIAAGLTIGLMSIDPLELEIKQRVGTVAEKAQAGRVLPLITRHHVLLVTLLLYNAAANEALPIFFDDLMPTPYAVGLSVTMVLLFGEILPSALFSGPKQLRIAAKLSGLVWGLIYLLAPIAMPLAWLLDRFVGPHNHRKRYTRAELSALIEIHQEVKQNRRRHHIARQPSHNGTTLTSATANTHKNNGGWSQLSEPLLAGASTNGSGLGEGGLYTSLRRGGPLSPSNGNGLSDGPPGSMLSQDEVDIVLGVLKIASKCVQDCMVPMEQVFCLSTDEVLSEETLALVMASGYSRIPVFQGNDVSHLRGFLLVKRLIVLDPKARRNVGSVSLRQPLVVSPSFPLIDLLNTFQEGRSHLALVSKLPQQAIDCMANGQPLHGDAAPLGIITLEDVIEEILQEEILDEHDRGRQFGESSQYYHNNNHTTRLGGAKQLLSASLLRKCPSGVCSDEGEGLLQQVAVDMAVVQHTASMPLPPPPPKDCTTGLCLPPPGLISPSQRFKRLSQSSAPFSSPHKQRHTTRPRSASNSASSSPGPSSSLSSPSKPRRVSLTSPLMPAPSSLDRTESAPGPAYVPDPCPSLVGRATSAPSGPSVPPSATSAPLPVGPISSMLLPPPPTTTLGDTQHSKARTDTQGPTTRHTPLPSQHTQDEGRGGEGEGEQDDKPILRSNPYF